MKKIGILNSEISKVISEMGHMDQIVICDAGLPIPDHVKRIDLALTKGVPGFEETLKTVLTELQVEKVIYAEELAEKSPQIQEQIDALFPDTESQRIPHDKFKELTRNAKAIIRTGEFTPYANIILQAGVVF
ncbi:D-ribose pyranase [Brevibacillus sp. SYSU BS000544]|uniref:D-ribose pyranase n=1 Tax=Brevibacillus sp. SYSU BS000544 TaxID=3416443 RepID=UPI003CE57862